MSRTKDDYTDHCNKMDGFEDWWDEHRRKIEDAELQQMYEQQYGGLHA